MTILTLGLRHGLLKFTFAFMFAAFECKAAAVAQGVVRDPMGDVPGAKITLTPQTEGHNMRATVTNESGAFSFQRVPPGEYEIIVRMRGFWQESVSHVRVPDGGLVLLEPIRLRIIGGCEWGQPQPFTKRFLSRIKRTFSKVDYSKVSLCQ